MTLRRTLWTALLGVLGFATAAILVVPTPAHATVTGFHGAQGSWGWTDVNGDGHSDLCGQSGCRLATATGFGATWALSGDLGWAAGRAWMDFNADAKADYCRVVNSGTFFLQCTVAGTSGFGATYTSGAVDPGYDAGRAWVDVTADYAADYCRLINSGGYRVQCTLSTRTGFGATFTSGVLDPGYDQGRTWADVNGDNRADYCRIVGSGTKYLQCTLISGNGFGATITSAGLDPGYDDSRRFADVNGDSRADYCRIVGSALYSSTNLRCTLSTGTGFGLTFTSPTLDAGYANTGGWADVNADGRQDYCRIVGGPQARCTLSTGSGFGTTFSTPISGYGSLGWTDFDLDYRADACRVESGVPRCTLSTGNAFGVTYG